MTSIEIYANDPTSNLVGFANEVFLDNNNKVIRNTILTSGFSGGRLGVNTFEPAKST